MGTISNLLSMLLNCSDLASSGARGHGVFLMRRNGVVFGAALQAAAWLPGPTHHSDVLTSELSSKH